MGHGNDAGLLADLGIEAGGVAERRAGLFSGLSGHELGGSAGGKAARDEEEYLPVAPRLVEQGGRDGGRLARARRSDEQCASSLAKRCEEVG